MLHHQLYVSVGCTRSFESRKAVEPLWRFVGPHPNSGLWYEIQPTSSRLFFCEFSTLHMYGETSDVHLWPCIEHSLPRVRHCQRRWHSIVDVTPTDDRLWIPVWNRSRQSELFCARIGMRRIVLRTAVSIHLILHLQDVAWYMSQTHFKTPQS